MISEENNDSKCWLLGDKAMGYRLLGDKAIRQ